MIYSLIVLMLGSWNIAFANEEISNSIQTYQEQVAQQPYQSELYQELAILSAQQQDWGVALGLAETALRIDPWSPRAKQIWEHLSEQEVLKSSFSSLDIWSYIYESGLLFIPWWLVLSVVALFFLGIIIRGGQIWFRLHFIRRYRLDLPRPWRAFGLASVSGLVVFIMAANKLYFETQSFARARTELALRSQPLEQGPELTKIPIGTKVRIIKTNDEWYFVKAGDHQLGWTNKDKLALLPTLQDIFQ